MSRFRQTWDNHHFFSGSDDPHIDEMVSQLKQDIVDLGDRCAPFTDLAERTEPIGDDELQTIVETIRIIHQHRTRLIEQLGNIRVFISSILSVDSQDPHAANGYRPCNKLRRRNLRPKSPWMSF